MEMKSKEEIRDLVAEMLPEEKACLLYTSRCV